MPLYKEAKNVHHIRYPTCINHSRNIFKAVIDKFTTMKYVFPCVFPPDSHSLNYFLTVFLSLFFHNHSFPAYFIFLVHCCTFVLIPLDSCFALQFTCQILLHLYAIFDLSVSSPSVTRMQ